MSFRGALLDLASHPAVRRVVSESAAARRLSKRWIAGETLASALAAAAELNAAGISATLDHLGENVSSVEEARASCSTYLDMIEAIHERGLDCNVSLKLTAMGLDLSHDLCWEHMNTILTRADECGGMFVRIDMEGSPYTQRTLDMVAELRHRYNNVGAVIQAYLHRSDADIAALTASRTRVRLCKGAYLEPASIAYQNKADVDRNYVRLMQELLASGVYHGVATHDPAMIQATIDYAGRNAIPARDFEFQMLYGIRRDLQKQLRADGWGMRVYIPFGSHWFPYMTRRLAERPANMLFIVRNLFKG